MRRQTLSGVSGNGKLREWREICQDVLRETSQERLYDLLEELLEALERIAHSPALRTELGEKGYIGFVRSWCREAHLELYFNLLNKVANNKFGGIPWSG